MTSQRFAGQSAPAADRMRRLALALVALSLYVYAPDGSVRADLVVTDASGHLAYALPPSAITGQYKVDLYGDYQAELAGIAFTNGPQVSTDKGDYRDNKTVHIGEVAFPPWPI